MSPLTKRTHTLSLIFLLLYFHRLCFCLLGNLNIFASKHDDWQHCTYLFALSWRTSLKTLSGLSREILATRDWCTSASLWLLMQKKVRNNPEFHQISAEPCCYTERHNQSHAVMFQEIFFRETSLANQKWGKKLVVVGVDRSARRAIDIHARVSRANASHLYLRHMMKWRSVAWRPGPLWLQRLPWRKILLSGRSTSHETLNLGCGCWEKWLWKS